MPLQQQAKHHIGVLKTTAIGGVFFLLPIVIIATFLAKFAQYSIWAAKAIEQYIPLQSVGGYPMLLVVGSILIVGLCFAAGLIARRSLARQFTETVEKQIQIAFPRYAIIKDRISGNIGGETFRTDLRPVLVLGHDGNYRFGLVVEEGASGWKSIYFPGSPDPWAGEVAIVSSDKVAMVNIDFIQAMTCLEKLGRGLQKTTNFQRS